jgi:hypothetical protein
MTQSAVVTITTAHPIRLGLKSAFNKALPGFNVIPSNYRDADRDAGRFPDASEPYQPNIVDAAMISDLPEWDLRRYPATVIMNPGHIGQGVWEKRP